MGDGGEAEWEREGLEKGRSGGRGEREGMEEKERERKGKLWYLSMHTPTAISSTAWRAFHPNNGPTFTCYLNLIIKK